VFAKLVAVILGIGVIGGGLLALRQQRLEAASELARAQVHIRAQDERLWKLRSVIARRTSPEQVREMASAIGPLRPLIPVLPVPGGDTRHATRDAPGPTIIDAAPLPRVPSGVYRAVMPSGHESAAPKLRSRYAKVETDR